MDSAMTKEIENSIKALVEDAKIVGRIEAYEDAKLELIGAIGLAAMGIDLKKSVIDVIKTLDGKAKHGMEMMNNDN